MTAPLTRSQSTLQILADTPGPVTRSQSVVVDARVSLKRKSSVAVLDTSRLPLDPVPFTLTKISCLASLKIPVVDRLLNHALMVFLHSELSFLTSAIGAFEERCVIRETVFKKISRDLQRVAKIFNLTHAMNPDSAEKCRDKLDAIEASITKCFKGKNKRSLEHEMASLLQTKNEVAKTQRELLLSTVVNLTSFDGLRKMPLPDPSSTRTDDIEALKIFFQQVRKVISFVYEYIYERRTKIEKITGWLTAADDLLVQPVKRQMSGSITPPSSQSEDSFL